MTPYKSYGEKLKDPRWQKKRLDVLNRDNFTCQLCNDKETTLDIHHFCYDVSGNPWDADDTDLITYCHPCHKLISCSSGEHVILVEKTTRKDQDIIVLAAIIEVEIGRYLSIFYYTPATDVIEYIISITKNRLNSYIDLFDIEKQYKLKMLMGK